MRHRRQRACDAPLFSRRLREAFEASPRTNTGLSNYIRNIVITAKDRKENRLMTAKANRQWRLAARPVGMLKETDFQLTESPVPTPNEGEMLVRNIYLSLAPSNCVWSNMSAT